MYQDFAEFYDILNEEADYPARADYLRSLFDRFDRQPSLLLDLACGTGGFSNEFASKGISVIGVDVSPEMLSRARQNSEQLGLDVLYLCQDATELDLYGTVDGVVCCLDSLNHITDYQALCSAIKNVSLFLEKDRLFIFDVNSLYKHREVLGNNTFVIETPEVYCVWQNEWDEKSLRTEMALDFFAEKNGTYDRFSDNVTERFYSDKQLEFALGEAGLKTEAILGEMTLLPPKDDCERLIYVTRKV